jgi:plastocyanin
MDPVERSSVIGRIRIAAWTSVACVLFAPIAAEAKTKTVDMGTPRPAQRTLGDTYGSEVNAFFPRSVAINVGDTVRFRPAGGFHTVDLPGRGEEPLGFVGAGAPVSGSVDALGAPFWFNGQPQLGFNPVLLQSNFGKQTTYSGARRVLSGLPPQGPPRPMTVRFTRRGIYVYFCNIHPGMRGTVRVQPKGLRVPTAAVDRRTVAAQIARAVAVAKDLSSVAPPAGSVYIGSAGRGGVEYFGMLPATVTVPVRTTLTFRMSPGSYDAHTATFGPGDPENQSDPTSYLGPMSASFNSPQFDPRATYPSEPGPPGATLTPELHGNGFWNTGVLDASRATPLPDANSVTFGAPGTYTYYCLIHPFMKGTVVVQ